MTDAKQFLKDNPNVKLGEFIDEQIPVKTFEYNPDTKRVSTITKMENQKTMYIDAPKEKLRCKSGEHIFRCIDNHKYMFACIRCPFKRQVYPTTYRFEDGRLIHKYTGKVV